MKYILEKNKIIITLILIIATYFGGIFLSGDIFVLITSLLWILFGFYYKLDQRIFLGLSFLSLVMSYPFFLIGKIFVADKIAKWQFIFILIGFSLWIVTECRTRHNSIKNEKIKSA